MGKTFKDNKNSDFEINKKLKREIKKKKKILKQINKNYEN